MKVCLESHWFGTYSENRHGYAYSGSDAVEAVRVARELGSGDQVRMDVEHPDDRICAIVTDVVENSVWFGVPLPEWV